MPIKASLSLLSTEKIFKKIEIFSNIPLTFALYECKI